MMENKPSKTELLLKDSEIIKKNDFETDRGVYTVQIVRKGRALFFHKMKNGKTVEIVKLN